MLQVRRDRIGPTPCVAEGEATPCARRTPGKCVGLAGSLAKWHEAKADDAINGQAAHPGAAPPPSELPPAWPADNRPTPPSRDRRPKAQARHAPQPKQVQKASPPLVCCPACGIQTSNLAKHYRKAHTAEGAARRLDRRRRREAEAAKDRLEQLRNKPAGGVRATRSPDLHPLKPPLKVRKGGKGKQAPLGQRTRPVESGGPGEPSRFVATRQADGAARDAKYGWGGSFRDQGQFGSYPSHDDMDDESNPVNHALGRTRAACIGAPLPSDCLETRASAPEWPCAISADGASLLTG